MKKLLVFIVAAIIYVSSAVAVNFTWVVDGETYDTTTCTVGSDLTVPNPAPTKYGYTFVGWRFDEIIGTGSQSGTPTPTNPIEPTFTPFGDTVLRAVGSGDTLVADSYDPIHNTITRRVGERVLKGDVSEEIYVWDGGKGFYLMTPDILGSYYQDGICTHDVQSESSQQGIIYSSGLDDFIIYFRKWQTALGISTVADFKQWLADQYANGTPVTVYYPLATPVEEQLQ